MGSVLYWALSAGCLLSAPLSGAPMAPGAYLYQPAFCIDEVLRGPAEAYVPQPGDIMLRLDHSVFWRVTHWMALAFDPQRQAWEEVLQDRRQMLHDINSRNIQINRFSGLLGGRQFTVEYSGED